MKEIFAHVLEFMLTLQWPFKGISRLSSALKQKSRDKNNNGKNSDYQCNKSTESRAFPSSKSDMGRITLERNALN